MARLHWLLAAAATLLLTLVCLPRADAAVAAIDLGTEWMKVALVKPGVPMEIVLNRESKRKTATAVTIRKSERFFGDDALNLFTRFPRDTYSRLLDLLGHYANDTVVADYNRRLPNMIEADERGAVAFRGDGDQQWLVEELVSMLLNHARQQAEEAAGVRIVDVVITVPPYFNQFERQAILDAAQLAGLNVLDLLNVDTAVALHFGITRKFNNTEHYIFYDMGAGSTKASLVSYSTVEKGKGKTKTSVAQYEVRAVAYDRQLGGHYFDLRLRQHLAVLFSKQKGVTSDVFKSERAMAKLLKEATRVKQILSANQEAYGRVEQLLDDVDLNVRVTRQEFEELCAELFERVPGPLRQVAQLAGIPLDDIAAVVLMGGGLRIPRVQAILKETLGRDLAQNINADEAAALGAAFKAAELSRQFKVKEVKLIDVQPYQINVRFQGPAAPSAQESLEKPAEGEDDVEQTPSEAAAADDSSVAAAEDAITERVLFPSFSPLNKRKQVSFLRDAPFRFDVVYAAEGAPASLQPSQRHIATVYVDGFDSEQVADYIKRTTKPTKVSVVLQLDTSGLVRVQKAEAIFEIEETQEAPKKKASLMDNIYDYLGMGKSKEENKDGAESKQDPEDNQDGDQAHADTDAGENADNQDGSDTKTATEAAAEDAKPAGTTEGGDAATTVEETETTTRIVTKRVKLQTTWVPVGFVGVTEVQKEAVRARKAEMDKIERLKIEHSEAYNGLEALIYKAKAFLDSPGAANYASAKELTSLTADVETAHTWFDDVGDSAETHEYKEKAEPIKDLLDRVEVRKEEERRRPEAVDEVRRLIVLARKAAQNVTKLVKDDDPNPWYTTEDVTKFTESVNATEQWLTTIVEAQDGKAEHEEAAVTVRELERRARQLEKEILALLKKPKPKPTKKAETASPKDKASEDEDTEDKTYEDKASEEDKAAEENAKSGTDQGSEGGAENANTDDATADGAEGEESATESAEGNPADEHTEGDKPADAAPETKDEL